MTDVDLLIFGCVVTFVAAGGLYVFFRERYEDETREKAPARTAPTRREV